jgi:hypothetical protein
MKTGFSRLAGVLGLSHRNFQNSLKLRDGLDQLVQSEKSSFGYFWTSKCKREFYFFKRGPQGFKASKSIKMYISGYDLLLSTFINPNPFEFLKNIILIKF